MHAHDTRLIAAQKLDLGRPFAIIAARLTVWAADRTARLARRRELSREMQQLRRFSDSELRDVGLTRGDFTAIESGAFRRD
jgi:uncharacterized protein YjiS (DUF1127 family)